MRFLSFSLLAFAAFDWPLPWLDRLGAAALGVAFLALAVGAAFSPSRRSLPFAIPTKTAAVADGPTSRELLEALQAAGYKASGAAEGLGPNATLEERIAAYRR